MGGWLRGKRPQVLPRCGKNGAAEPLKRPSPGGSFFRAGQGARPYRPGIARRPGAPRSSRPTQRACAPQGSTSPKAPTTVAEEHTKHDLPARRRARRRRDRTTAYPCSSSGGRNGRGRSTQQGVKPQAAVFDQHGPVIWLFFFGVKARFFFSLRKRNGPCPGRGGRPTGGPRLLLGEDTQRPGRPLAPPTAPAGRLRPRGGAACPPAPRGYPPRRGCCWPRRSS